MPLRETANLTAKTAWWKDVAQFEIRHGTNTYTSGGTKLHGAMQCALPSSKDWGLGGHRSPVAGLRRLDSQ